MQPTDVTNVVTKATAFSWEAGLLALLVVVLTSLVVIQFRAMAVRDAAQFKAMWTHIQHAAVDSQDVIDDNTLGFLQIARAFAHRPCLYESDADRLLTKMHVTPEDFGEYESHVRRVLERKEKRLVVLAGP
jgi:hypothetical protein